MAGPDRHKSGQRPTPSKLDVPTGAREPIGRDRATKRRDAPPRTKRPDTNSDGPPRPQLPDDEQPDIPKGVRKEIERALGPRGTKAHDVCLALSIGSAAIEQDRPDVAVEVLGWAKHQAPRIATIREAYGVALYLQQRYAAALTELQAYRRLTDHNDQNHLIADCLRALGRDLDQIAEAAETLAQDPQAPEDRRAEAAIVWAAAVADAGDLPAGRSIIRRFLERPRSNDAEHDLRARYLAADLAERDHDNPETIRQLELITAVDDNFLDTNQRLDQAHQRQH